MKDITPSDSDYKLWFTIRRVHEAINTIRRSEIRHLKLSTIESGVLFIVKTAKNKITPAEIARQLYKDPHSISQLLRRMEKRGLIENIKGFPQKNMIQVKVTEKGLKAFKLSQNGKKLSMIMSILTDEDRAQLLRILDMIKKEALEFIFTR